MDWFVDTKDASAVGDLRRQLGAYLRRHGAPGSDFAAAELVFAELLTNVIKHSGSAAWVAVDWGARRPRVTIHDLGPGFELAPPLPEEPTPGGRGLFIAAHLADEIAVAAKRGGGVKVSAVLPVPRRSERSYASPRPSSRALPAPDEARPDGTFGRESFLRALVVHLAQAVEQHDGPALIEEMVTQVGTDVGGRIEAEYRRARDIVGRLDSDQLADVYVRLKTAIEGDFYVVEADDEKIVPGNRRCPFGDAVKWAPGLCRMTSSVFGGIAARNTGQAAVVLEERIAVGDPECKVVVWLREPPREQEAVAHVYRGPAHDASS